MTTPPAHRMIPLAALGLTTALLGSTGSSATAIAAPTTATQHSPMAGPASIPSTMGYNTLRLPHMSISVGPGPARKRIPHLGGFWLTVCVRTLPAGYSTGVPVSQAPWTLTAGTVSLPKVANGYTPALQPTTLHAGQCARGFVTFNTSTAPAGNTFDAYVLRYTSSFGDRGIWAFD